MSKFLFAIIILSIFVKCKSAKIAKVDNSPGKRSGESLAIDSNCLENLTFKKLYFYHISKVDSLMNIGEARLGNNKSLGFISKYTYVDWASMANYARNYTFGAYEKDRKGWILWYELKKCSNIQLKK